ncbi:MAG: hypothetical protein DMF66_14125 [Acidobacteria bacterium]|nr:MAG: hypothetical protein DMF66_14125 [Acidobacteriota bacterium]
MEKTLKVINRMEADGVIGRYAIGGAVAAIFYIEPFTTYDLDNLVVLTPIYEYLARKGYEAEGEAVNVEGWPVQFLPAYNPLVAEALKQAVEIKFKRTPTRVMSAEHLVAIMLQTGRTKDYARAAKFLEEDVVDVERLEDILSRHELSGKWREFSRRFKP